MVEWIIGIVLLILAAPVAIYIFGALQPGVFRGEASGTINAPPETVFRDILDLKRFPLSGSMMKAREDLPGEDGKPRWKENIGMSEITGTVSETDAPRRVVFDLDDSKVGMTAHWVVDLEPAGGSATNVRIEQTGLVRLGSFHAPIFRFIMRKGGGATTGPRDLIKRLAAAHGGGV
jgi:uncharacterized protein YndB with AHSA1/START domain